MNMKKTMAAIAAGAVAVSAMATTVSAVEDQTLNYDLTADMAVWTPGTVNLTANFTQVTFGDTDVRLGFNGVKADEIIVTVKDTTGGAGNKVFKENSNEGSKNFWTVDQGFMIIAKEALAGIEEADITIVAKAKHNQAMFDGGWAGAYNVEGDFAGTTAFIDLDSDWTADAETAGIYFANITQPTKTVRVVPMETTLNNNYDIIEYLEDNGYVNVGPVLNDAIENYETTTFIFNSAKERVRFEVKVGNDLTDLKAGSKADAIAKAEAKVAEFSEAKGAADKALEVALEAYKEANDEDYDAATADPDADETKAVVEAQGVAKAAAEKLNEWKKYDIIWYYTTETSDSTDYTKFTQHLYNGQVSDYFFAKDPSGYLGLDWAGYNLFQGGLVINEGWTMSLADTTMFDWGESTVSFNWDAIRDAAQTSNAYALYLHTLELATSVDWYWDGLDVVLVAGAVDDATSDAEAKADDETLEEEVIEEEVEEEIVEEEIVEEEIVEEEVEEVVEEEVEEEVEVSNPTTGNASVALAVIPVALAAAAVVAKKRN